MVSADELITCSFTSGATAPNSRQLYPAPFSAGEAAVVEAAATVEAVEAVKAVKAVEAVEAAVEAAVEVVAEKAPEKAAEAVAIAEKAMAEKAMVEKAAAALSPEGALTVAAQSFEFLEQCTAAQKTELHAIMEKYPDLDMRDCCNIPAGSEPPAQCKLVEKFLPQCVCPKN